MGTPFPFASTILTPSPTVSTGPSWAAVGRRATSSFNTSPPKAHAPLPTEVRKLGCRVRGSFPRSPAPQISDYDILRYDAGGPMSGNFQTKITLCDWDADGPG